MPREHRQGGLPVRRAAPCTGIRALSSISFFSLLAIAFCASCTGTGSSADSGEGEDVYGTSAGSSSPTSSGTSLAWGGTGAVGGTAVFSTADLLRLANSGDAQSLVDFVGAEGGDSASFGSGTSSVRLDAESLGMPEGGSVLLSITAGSLSYEEERSAGNDGSVAFSVPQLAAGTRVTVKLKVKDADGAVVLTGSTTQVIRDGSSQVSVALSEPVPQVLTGDGINERLSSFSGATGFFPSRTPPPAGAAKVILSEAGSDGTLVAWYDGAAIRFYAAGFTDRGRKIPLGKSASSMFQDMTALTDVDLSAFDTGAVEDMGYMFSGCSALSGITGLEGLDTGKVTDMSYMFYECEALTTLNLSSFNTARVANMTGMFNECTFLQTIYVSPSFVTSAVTSSTRMFYDCLSLSGKGGGIPDTEVDDAHVDKGYARINGAGGLPGYFTAAP